MRRSLIFLAGAGRSFSPRSHSRPAIRHPACRRHGLPRRDRRHRACHPHGRHPRAACRPHCRHRREGSRRHCRRQAACRHRYRHHRAVFPHHCRHRGASRRHCRHRAACRPHCHCPEGRWAGRGRGPEACCRHHRRPPACSPSPGLACRWTRRRSRAGSDCDTSADCYWPHSRHSTRTPVPRPTPPVVRSRFSATVPDGQRCLYQRTRSRPAISRHSTSRRDPLLENVPVLATSRRGLSARPGARGRSAARSTAWPARSSPAGNRRHGHPVPGLRGRRGSPAAAEVVGRDRAARRCRGGPVFVVGGRRKICGTRRDEPEHEYGRKGQCGPRPGGKQGHDATPNTMCPGL